MLAFSTSTQVLSADTRTILLLGDSLSSGYGIDLDKGWVRMLENRLVDQQCVDRQSEKTCLTEAWRVVNASVSGETVGGGLRRLPRLLQQNSPDVVIVELGGNDGLRGYPVQRMRLELRKIVDMAKANGAQVLLVGMMIPPNYGPTYSDAFSAQYVELSKTLDIPLVPFLLDKVVFTEGYMQQDRIHPTEKAQTQILDNVWPELKDLLLEVSGEKLSS